MEGSYTTNQKTKECIFTQIKAKTNTKGNDNNKKTHQRNKKFRSVTIQVPEDRRNKNKEPRSENTPNDPISTISDLHELKSEDKNSTQQRMTSVAGHPKIRLYIDSRASLHILFNKELMGELYDTDKPLNIQAGDKPFHIKQIRSLHQALRHLPLPVTAYHYSETAIANLLLFVKLADKYYIICNTRIDDTIFVQSKDDNKYLQFQQDYKHNLYYMNISEAELDKHCYVNTVKEKKTTFSILDQKRTEAVRILQERCGFLSDKDFINTLEYNSIKGVDFGRRDVKIANKIYGYSKGAVMGKFKHPQKGCRWTEPLKMLPPHCHQR